MKKNEVLTAITDELDAAGVVYVVKPGGKHLKVLFTLNGRKQTCVCSFISSTSWRAQACARTQVRRILRGMA